LPAIAGVEADSRPRLRLQIVWPVVLFVALITPLSPSWKIRSPPITGGNSSSVCALLTHTRLNGGCRLDGAGKKRVCSFA